MLKLIIVDDERVIRETISNTIDWEKYDIEIAGLCQNGIEAYDMILDESPDIVLTDIKMPGMSGLELIERAHNMDLPTQFIILSGYGEFEFAKKAMKYGVRHYLLKPCNENQILECVNECKKDYFQALTEKHIREQQISAQNGMLCNVVSSIINDCLCQNIPLEQTMPQYAQYLDFHFTPYRLFYIYFLEYESLQDFLDVLKSYCQKELPHLLIHQIYVKNTLLIFFQNIGADYQKLLYFIQHLYLSRQNVEIELEDVFHSSLHALLQEILEKLKRYSMIYVINNFHITVTCNYNIIISRLQSLYQLHRDSGGSGAAGTEQIAELLDGIDNAEFLRQLASSLFLKIASDSPGVSTVEVAEWLMTLEQEPDIIILKDIIIQKFLYLSDLGTADAATSSMTRQIYDYVDRHLQDSNLTLKQIAETELFMNVDYVSKRFYKENGLKFSQYLTNMRVNRAKELILNAPETPIKLIAEQVGCGNNPQYFSHLFKKQTGMTPTEYITSVRPAGH